MGWSLKTRQSFARFTFAIIPAYSIHAADNQVTSKVTIIGETVQLNFCLKTGIFTNFMCLYNSIQTQGEFTKMNDCVLSRSTGMQRI